MDNYGNKCTVNVGDIVDSRFLQLAQWCLMVHVLSPSSLVIWCFIPVTSRYWVTSPIRATPYPPPVNVPAPQKLQISSFLRETHDFSHLQISFRPRPLGDSDEPWPTPEEDTFPRDPLGLAHGGGSDLAAKLVDKSKNWDLFIYFCIYCI
jgi:hypothetical protein